MNKKLEEAIKKLKAIKDAKLDSDSEIAVFEFAENDKYIDIILNYIENSIPKEVIKKKIEKLDKEYNEILSDYGNIDTDVIFDIPNKNVRKYLDELITKIIILQELLEVK